MNEEVKSILEDALNVLSLVKDAMYTVTGCDVFYDMMWRDDWCCENKDDSDNEPMSALAIADLQVRLAFLKEALPLATDAIASIESIIPQLGGTGANPTNAN